MKILIISYKFTPLIAPRALRWEAVSKELIKKGHEIDVLCYQYLDLKKTDNIKGIRVFRVRQIIRNYYSKTEIINNKNNLNNKFDSNRLGIKNYEDLIKSKNIPIYKVCGYALKLFKKGARGFSRIFRKYYTKIRNLHTIFIRDFIWPDYGVYWVIPAVIKGQKLIYQEKYDIVISVSWPVVGQLVGLILNWLNKGGKRKYKWIVDIGDPLSFNKLTPPNNFQRYHKLNERFEKALLSTCYRFVVTESHTLDRYKKEFKIDFNNGVVIPPVVPTPVFNNKYKKSEYIIQNEHYLNIVFFGSLRKINRSPKSLLKLFNILWEEKRYQKVILYFIGDSRQCEGIFNQYGSRISKNIFLYEPIPHSKLITEIDSADVLLNIGNKTDYQVPSKVVEYMATGKPIINIAQIRNDTSYFLLEKYPNLLNLYIPNEKDIFSNLEKLKTFLDNLPKKLEKSEIIEIVSDYSPSSVSRNYEHLFRDN